MYPMSGDSKMKQKYSSISQRVTEHTRITAQSRGNVKTAALKKTTGKTKLQRAMSMAPLVQTYTNSLCMGEKHPFSGSMVIVQPLSIF